MELPSRPKTDRYTRPGHYNELERRLRNNPACGDIPVLVAYAFDWRTRLGPYLFADMQPRLFAEGELLAGIVAGGALDLSRPHAAAALDADTALTIVATRRSEVFRAFPAAPRPGARGEFRINPLYAEEAEGDRVRLRLQFPSEDYEQEYGAARLYLAEDVAVDRAALAALPAARLPAALADLARRRVILDLPKNYY